MLNRVVLMGRLCKDLEVKFSGSGLAYSSFTLAVNRRAKKDAEQQADFIQCKVFGKCCEFMARHMGKGRQIAIEGRIQTGSYDKDGTKVYTTDVIVDNCYFADTKQSSQTQSDAAEPETKVEPTEGFYPIDINDELPF